MVLESFWGGNPLRKVASLIQLTTEIFVLLVVPFPVMLFLLDLVYRCCMRCILTCLVFPSSLSGQYLSFCIPWASVDFKTSFICDFSSRDSKIHGLAPCLLWHISDRMTQGHKLLTLFFKLLQRGYSGG